MAKSTGKQRTRLIKVVGVTSDFLSRKVSGIGTRKYKVWSTGDELFSGLTCIAMWQKTRQGSRVLVDRTKGSRTTEQCKDVLRWEAQHRGISYVSV